MLYLFNDYLKFLIAFPSWIFKSPIIIKWSAYKWTPYITSH